MTTTSFETRFRSALSNVERSTFINHVRENAADLTLAEIAKMASGNLAKLLGDVTIGEIISGQSSEPAKKGTKISGTTKHPETRSDAPAEKKAPRKATLDVRTPAGRAAYDATVLTALKQLGATTEDKRTSAPDVAAIVGGKPEQLRSALNRLIGDGKVNFSGQARGTRYWIA